MGILNTNLLVEHNVLLNMKGGTREEIFEALAQPLVDSGIVNDKSLFVEDLITREEQMTTVVTKDIAFPHARTKSASLLGLVIGVLGEGEVTTFSEDGSVKIFFLIAIPHISPASHLLLLQFLAKFCKSKARIEQLMRAKKPKAVIRALSSFDK